MSSRRRVRTSYVVAALGLTLLLAACGGDPGDQEAYHPTSTPPLAQVDPYNPSASPSTPAPTGQPTTPATPTPSTTAPQSQAPLRIVVLGDSAAAEHPADCRACHTAAELYAGALTRSLGRQVTVDNRARRDHTRIGDLATQVNTDMGLRRSLATADVVIVSIGFYDAPPWAAGRPCGRNLRTAEQQLAAVANYSPACNRANITAYRIRLDKLYTAIGSFAAKPGAVKLAMNMYNNWPGHPTLLRAPAALSKRGIAASIPILNQWNPMQCAAATSTGFSCVDVYHAFNGPRGSRPPGGLLAPDRVNPSARGQAVIAGLLARAPRPRG